MQGKLLGLAAASALPHLIRGEERHRVRIGAWLIGERLSGVDEEEAEHGQHGGLAQRHHP